MRVVRQIALPQPLPRLPQEQRDRRQEQARLQTRRPTFEELATLASNYDRSTEDHSLALAKRYSLSGQKRHQHRHMLRGMHGDDPATVSAGKG